MMATLSVFKIITGGEWLSLLQSSMDSEGIDLVPRNKFSLSIWFVYYIVILIGNVMILNLLVGLVLDNFK